MDGVRMWNEELALHGVAGPFDSFLAVDEISRLAARFTDIATAQPVQPLFDAYSVRDWHLVDDDVLAALTHPLLVSSLSKTITADNLILWRSKLFDKFPGDGPIDWHQDYGYFDGEEIGGHRPALFPLGGAAVWNWTVWIALTDVGPDQGPLEFVPGSHLRRYATEMVPMTQSDAYTDPHTRVSTKEELLQRALDNSLVLDVDTRAMIGAIDAIQMTFEELVEFIRRTCDAIYAIATVPFEARATKVYEMRAGQYLIFNQRTMHRSKGAPRSAPLRLALSARYCLGSTLVYPQRQYGEFTDGSGLDIRKHRCVKALGTEFHDGNVY
jgi:non-heme Fe2+,alpha-ketoglutarate-dependent halogenase